MKSRIVCRNDRGFILVEHLIALLITAIVVQVLYGVLLLSRAYEVDFINPSYLDVEIMGAQMEKEARLMKKLGVKNGNVLELYPYGSGGVVTYRVNNGRLLRQVGGSGGEIYLYNCQSFGVELVSEQAAILTIRNTKNQSYSIYLTTLQRGDLVPPPPAEDETLAVESLIEEEANDLPNEDIEIDSTHTEHEVTSHDTQ